MGKTHGRFVWLFVAAALIVSPTKAVSKQSEELCAHADKPAAAEPKNRAESVAAIMARLGLGKGSVIADVGAGGGQDTWVFAEIVGETGSVIAEEIVTGPVESLKKEADGRGLPQVHALLGGEDDPCLPADSVDLVFLHYVYHHLTKPREMLQGIWRGLKPGGFLVVVDQRRGTLQDWVPRNVRGKEHHWIAEATVVREAREEGFVFVGCAEECWHAASNFVLILARPKTLKAPGRDPDPFQPLLVEKSSRLFLPISGAYRHPVFVALGEARQLIPPILGRSAGDALDIVLEEWATQKDERPFLAPNISLPSVLTRNGDPGLGPELIDAVFFLDSYHLLFHAETLLAKIGEKLSPTGAVYLLDREAEEAISRREASHRRKIRPETVIQEMKEAGFFMWFRGPRPAKDRFLMVFGKRNPQAFSPEVDPFVGGPEFQGPLADWLMENYWRLRGLKTVDGRFVRFAAQGREGPVEVVPVGSPHEQSWEIPKEKVVLDFEKKDNSYWLVDYRSSELRRQTSESGL